MTCFSLKQLFTRCCLTTANSFGNLTDDAFNLPAPGLTELGLTRPTPATDALIGLSGLQDAPATKLYRLRSLICSPSKELVYIIEQHWFYGACTYEWQWRRNRFELLVKEALAGNGMSSLIDSSVIETKHFHKKTLLAYAIEHRDLAAAQALLNLDADILAGEPSALAFAIQHAIAHMDCGPLMLLLKLDTELDEQGRIRTPRNPAFGMVEPQLSPFARPEPSPGLALYHICRQLGSPRPATATHDAAATGRRFEFSAEDMTTRDSRLFNRSCSAPSMTRQRFHSDNGSIIHTQSDDAIWLNEIIEEYNIFQSNPIMYSRRIVDRQLPSVSTRQPSRFGALPGLASKASD